MTPDEAIRRAVVTAIQSQKDAINARPLARVTFEAIIDADEITVLTQLKLAAVKV